MCVIVSVNLSNQHLYINLDFFKGNIFVILHLFVWILLRLFYRAVSHKIHKYREHVTRYSLFRDVGKSEILPLCQSEKIG